MGIRISAVREIEDPRLATALSNPLRRKYAAKGHDPLDPLIECPLGRMRLDGLISQAEYEAGVRWRKIYQDWLHSMGAPNPFCASPGDPDSISFMGDTPCQMPLSSDGINDEKAENVAKLFRTGERALMRLGRRVFHAVNAVAVYEETEELGDFEFTAYAAKKGLTALAEIF